MNTQDEVAAANRKLWEEEVKKGCGYTIPWLDLDVEAFRAYRERETDVLPEPPSHRVVMLDVREKDVLCLALGGGQQSTVYSLLGARVTVVDLAEGQIEGDRRAAAHYGYEITAIRGDMRDLSFLEGDSFDLVVGSALAYVPDVREVYTQVARVLRTGGLYWTAGGQSALDFLEWNGKAYCIARPYADRIERRDDGGIEFRHYMDDLFNGLIELGFSIQGVHEPPHDRRPDPKTAPGSWNHERLYVGGTFDIVARKERKTSQQTGRGDAEGRAPHP